MTPSSRLFASLTLCAAALACAPAAQQPVPQGGKPTLLVFLTIDQMRPDYVDRFRPQLHGGLDRLFSGGAVFTDGHHDHAITETAPGHATTMSGRYPRSTGITRNIAGVNDRNSPLIGARDLGASPFRFRGTTLTDWLTAADSRTRALSVSAKDRAAILPIGRSKQQVYWYANNGLFTTSVYYRDTLPEWVTQFNALRLPQRYAGRAWTTLLADREYPDADSVPFETLDHKDIAFPHRFPADSAAAAAAVRFTPMIDELTLRLALTGLRKLDLGRGPEIDVLAISLSATDYVGHFFGPESKEQHDQILRLDRVLGAFFDTLYTLRDSSRIVVALTADHGVGLIPELHGHRRVAMGPAMAAARAAIAAAGGDTTALDLESGAFFVEKDRLGGRGLTVDRVVDAFMPAARDIPGVARVERYQDLATHDTTTDYVARRWLHMFPEDMRPDAVVTLAPGDIYDYPIVATHGSPNLYDSHVPMVFYGPPFKPGKYPRPVRTVDIAPTLARVLGVTPAERLDGRPLTEALKPVAPGPGN
ncbi:MAG: alkaline phosphatase family protein [Gemmatimonadales bacterium]